MALTSIITLEAKARIVPNNVTDRSFLRMFALFEVPDNWLGLTILPVSCAANYLDRYRSYTYFGGAEACTSHRLARDAVQRFADLFSSLTKEDVVERAASICSEDAYLNDTLIPC